jgi:serine/threonine protein phosphatase PrpC
MEDAWCVLEAAPMAGERWDAFAVFDGIGGSPRGQEAARAAADGLRAALLRAKGPTDVLRQLDGAVLATGGATTAVAVLAPCERPGKVWLLGAGDSSVHAAGVAGSLLPQDRVGRHGVTDGLGLPLAGGHARELEVPPGGALLLCTDGVDEVVGPVAVQECLAAQARGPQEALAALFAAVQGAGAPDNATALLVRRPTSRSLP